MYEVDHQRCFIVKSGGALKTDNSVKREYSSLGYHGANYEDIPQRHAGWCKLKADEDLAEEFAVAEGSDLEEEFALEEESAVGPPVRSQNSGEISVGTFAAQQETSYVLNGFALLGLGALLYGAGAHYFQKQEAKETTHPEL